MLNNKKMNIKINNITPIKNIVKFYTKERWIQMKDFLEGNYFVSTEGRVMRLTPTGIFRIMKSHKSNDQLRVCLYYQSNGSLKTRTVLVGSLVLRYFRGGYFPRRRFAFKNGNFRDCRLANIYWLHGFDNGVDYEYIFNAKLRYMNKEDKQVIEYLRNKKIDILFKLVKDLLPKIRKAILNKNLKYDFDKDLSSIVLELSDRLKNGKYKPISNRVKYKKIDFIPFLIGIVVDLIVMDLKYNFTPAGLSDDRYLSLKYLNSNNSMLKAM